MAERDKERDRGIGRNVAALRGESSQRVIADAMVERGHGWKQATVWSVEKGERALKLAEAADLAEVLGVGLHELVAAPLDVAHRRWINRLTDRLVLAEVELEYAAVKYETWRSIMLKNANDEPLMPELALTPEARDELRELAQPSAAEVVGGDLTAGRARFEAEGYGFEVEVDPNAYLNHFWGEKRATGRD